MHEHSFNFASGFFKGKKKKKKKKRGRFEFCVWCFIGEMDNVRIGI
jgi:hypothetical protein